MSEADELRRRLRSLYLEVRITEDKLARVAAGMPMLPKPKKRKRGPRPPSEKAQQVWQVYAEHPEIGLRQVGHIFGISGERVRQLVLKVGKEAAEVRRAEKRENAAAEVEAERIANAKPCRVCGKPVLRGKTLVTCSHECAELWVSLRYSIDDEARVAHKVVCAKWAVAHPDKVDAARLRYAERVLAGEVEPRGRWSVVGSAAAEHQHVAGVPPVAAGRRRSKQDSCHRQAGLLESPPSEPRDVRPTD